MSAGAAEKLSLWMAVWRQRLKCLQACWIYDLRFTIYAPHAQLAVLIRSVPTIVNRKSRVVNLRLRRSAGADGRSEEHTSELQSPCNLVCRLLLEKKKPYNRTLTMHSTRDATGTMPPDQT